MKLLQEESLEMSMEPSSLSFADYSSALQRVQRRAALKRAVMNAGIGGSFEMVGGDDQERRDRELLDVWERQHGIWLGY